MENLNAKTIKKALECCVKKDILQDQCENCPYENKGNYCMDEMLKNALTLINSQEQRIGKLAEEVEDLKVTLLARTMALTTLKAVKEELTEEKNEVFEKGAENLTRLEEAYLKLEAENLKLTEDNERLRAENKALVNDNAELKNQIQEEISEEDLDLFDEFTKLLHEGIREAKADTVRAMQERLKMCFGTYVLGYKIPLTEALKAVDQIAKEMLEGEK